MRRCATVRYSCVPHEHWVGARAMQQDGAADGTKLCVLLQLLERVNEPIGGQWPHGLKPAAGDNALGDGQVRSREVSPYDASWVNVMFYQDKLQMGAKLLDI